MEELVTKHSAIMDKYDPEKKVELLVDEWGGWYDVEPGTNGAFLYQQNTMRDAMIAGTTLNTFNNHCDRVKMANLAQAINVLQSVILTDGSKMLLTPTYHVMEMYTVHHDATLLPVDLKTESYVFGNEKLPAISASASVDKAGKTHLSLVNIDASKSHEVAVSLKGVAGKTISGRILTAPRLQDHNTFDKPNTVAPVAFANFKRNGDNLSVTMPPYSVVVLEIN